MRDFAGMSYQEMAEATELPLGTDDGMPVECAAAFDDLRTIPKHALTERIARLSLDRVGDACRALRIAVDC